MNKKHVVLDLINSFAPQGIGAEIGVLAGELSSFFLRRTNIKFLYLVDPWKSGYSKMHDSTSNLSQEKMDQVFQEVQNLSDQYPDRSKIIKKTSLEASEEIEDESLDFIYIDACHDYENVLQDLECWVPKVKPGKLIMGDDWYRGFPGIVRAVIDYAKNHNDFIGVINDYAKCDLKRPHSPCPALDPVVNKSKGQWWTLKK